MGFESQSKDSAVLVARGVQQQGVEEMVQERIRTALTLGRRYVLTGLLTAIPIWATWLVLRFMLRLLAEVGNPIAARLSANLRPNAPTLADWLMHPGFQALIAAALILLVLYLLGWTATRVVGRRLIRGIDRLFERIPLVKTIYGSVRQLVGVLQQEPGKAQRVVLINFPSPDMKTVGLVTRTLTDDVTGREFAAVYVPTTPNPTSGYLEIVPLDRITPTDWTVDEAMTFVISAGAVAPETMRYDRVADGPGDAPT